MSSEPTSSKDPLVERVQFLFSQENVPKLTREHLIQLLQLIETEAQSERDHRRTKPRLILWIVLVTFGSICFLSWLFLYFGRPEFVEKIITLITGFIGGAGVSRLLSGAGGKS